MSPTFTPTPSISQTHTASPTITVTATPEEVPYLDRNVLDVSTGDVVNVRYWANLAGPINFTVKVYNLTGELLRTFDQGATLVGGWNTLATWDGRNEAGNFVGRGIYFIYIQVEGSDKVIRRLYVVK